MTQEQGVTQQEASRATSGPWLMVRGSVTDPWTIQASSGDVVARTAAARNNETENANARLIAAAPDLADALQRVYRVMDGLDVLDTAAEKASLIEEVRAALAKAGVES